MTFKKNTITALLILAAAFTYGCGLLNGDGESVRNTDRIARAEFNHDFTVEYRTQIRIEAINGSILMTGSSDRNRISVSGIRTVGSESSADAKDYLERLEVRITEFAGAILIETLQPQDTGGRTLTVDYEIALPDFLSSHITQINGTATIGGMRNNLDLELVNGDADVHNITGNTSVSVVNGTIESEISLPPGGTLNHSVVNGKIELLIPDTTSAIFSGQVVNGDIKLSGLDLSDPVISEKSISGTLSDGNGTINLQVVNGQILVNGRK